ncbi:hypothetical protein GQ44DRAFT_730384 [Phaeosphaeriaceae sp. PMI808]|nr:hypothetical protein GQ44DRAFT_730384 [Phaeosphaeriaceae sp. PMI808]
MQQNLDSKWPIGVVSGSIVLSMLEILSRTESNFDYRLMLWLQQHYIEPFAVIDRSDGLVVTEKDDYQCLFIAHERYIRNEGDIARAETLWVPGLEPVDPPKLSADFINAALPALPQDWMSKVWTASDMYKKDGIKVQHKGKCEGKWSDKNNWERVIWRVSDV